VLRTFPAFNLPVARFATSKAHHNALLSIFVGLDAQVGASITRNIALRALSSKG
jgi:hypothetical protein